ncbi:MAG: ATP cone domain-containing protein [Promethearchaeota archaeon]
MSNNSFSFMDLYPKYVINSKGERKKFNENNIAKVLNKETGLDINIADKVAEDVLRKIIGLGVDEISSNYIRELVCVELTQRGMNKYRNLFARSINLESISFKLDEDFIDRYRGKDPDWGPLGHITYKRTYARIIENENRKEEFFETVRRVVEGCYSIQKEHCMKLSLPWSDIKAQKSAQRMYEKIWNFKMSPPGRGLWMMGTEFIARHGSMALNNCFAYETEIITKEGIKKIGDLAGTNQLLLTKNGKWIEAPIRNFGKQKLMKITFRRQGIIKEIYATPDHRWFINSKKKEYKSKGNFECKTSKLQKYYNLAYVFSKNIGKPDLRPSPFGITRGISFGDRIINHFYLYGEKEKELMKYFPLNSKTINSNICKGGAIHISNLPKYWKTLPPINEDINFLYGWLAGYFAVNGNCEINGNIRIASSKKENILFVRDVCSILGIGYDNIREERRHKEFNDGEYGYEHTMYILRLMPSTLKEDFFIISNHKNNFVKTKEKRFWQVVSVEETDRYEDVYCATVPETHSFALEGNILTGNCGFASTADIDLKYSKAFEFVMDALMLGVGVGFDTKGAGKITIKKPKEMTFTFEIPDSREGWVDALRLTLEAYFLGKQKPIFDFSKIRPAGEPIRGFGGIASGPEPLKEMLEDIGKILDTRIGKPITSLDIVDIMNMIGKCVVAGNVRRSAEISLGNPTDLDFILAKQDQEKLYSHRWASNNSVFAKKGLNYSFIANQIAVNGEPGILWLENARAYSRMGDKPDYKDKKAAGVNPCGEQTLESFELCCVTAKTRIQTKNGAPYIADVVDKEVEVWNGDRWSKVIPFLAAENKEIYRVYISDGSYLDCTADHKWHIKPPTARIFRSIETKDLKPGDYIIPFEIDQEFGGIYEPNAFEYGLFSGIGYIDNEFPMICVYGEKSKLTDLDVKGTWYKEQIKEGSNEPYNRLNLKNVIDIQLSKQLNDKQKGLPDVIFSWDKQSILEFIAGLIETDGNLCKQVNTDNYKIFGNEEKIRDLQILLRRVGINHSIIYIAGEAGEETIFGTRDYSIYCLYIPSYECGEIPTRIKKATRIGSRYTINNRHPNGQLIDRARKQKIVKVEKLNKSQPTYCFSEPENHMGVFGNVLTYQCLVETFPSRHDSFEEFRETLKYAYLYAKSVTLVNTHWKETNAVMLKNRRMGISQTGIIEAFVKHGRRTILKWCDKAYSYIRKLDEKYSDWLCIPKSIKITTIKPSGTVSLLPGVTPGIHYPHSKYYIRRIRLSKNSDLLEPIKEAGYPVEEDSYSPNTMVAEFPVHEKYFDRSKNEVSIWEQAQNAADYQRYWSDNQVSVTITFKQNEAKEIKHVLECFEDKLKSASFLPIKDHGYKQAPYEEITKEEYETRISKIKPLVLSKSQDRAIGTKFCDGDSCQVDLG